MTRRAKALFVTVPLSEWSALTRKRVKNRGGMLDDRTLDIRQALAALRKRPEEKIRIPLEPLSHDEAEKRRHMLLVYADRYGMKVRTMCRDGYVYITTPKPEDARCGPGGRRALGPIEPEDALPSYRFVPASEIRDRQRRSA